MPLIEKSRTLCPSGRFPPTFIHQVIIIPGLNILVNNCGKISQYIYEINLGEGEMAIRNISGGGELCSDEACVPSGRHGSHCSAGSSSDECRVVEAITRFTGRPTNDSTGTGVKCLVCTSAPAVHTSVLAPTTVGCFLPPLVLVLHWHLSFPTGTWTARSLRSRCSAVLVPQPS